MLAFKAVTLDARPAIQPFLDEWALEHSDSSFGSLYIWAEGYSIKYAIEEDALFIQIRDGNKPLMQKPPFTRGKDADMTRPLLLAEQSFKEASAPVVYSSVSRAHMAAMEKAFPGKYEFKEKRGFFDYVYKSADLITLSGGKYHAKRNHISSFRANNAFSYERYTPRMLEECREMYSAWLSGKVIASPGLEQERLAVEAALLGAEALGFVGGVLRVNGAVEAFAFGERIGADMAIIHVEKANSDIRGLYPMINQQFIENEFYDVEWINREEDMGEPGLRKAKLSYHPARMVEKFSACIVRES